MPPRSRSQFGNVPASGGYCKNMRLVDRHLIVVFLPAITSGPSGIRLRFGPSDGEQERTFFHCFDVMYHATIQDQ